MIKTFMKCGTAPTNLRILGIPFDQGVTNRAGAAAAPNAIREASHMLCDGPNLDAWCDCGNIGVVDGIPESLELIKEYVKPDTRTLYLGGDHTITQSIIEVLAVKYPDLVLVHFDAHHDVWDEKVTGTNHGTWLRTLIENKTIQASNVYQYGIRSPAPRDVNDWHKTSGILSQDVSTIHRTAFKRISTTKPVYVTFDIDCIDPSQAPGTGTPEIGGVFTWQVMELLSSIWFKKLNIISADVVEVCPQYDIAQLTSLTAATIGWKLIEIMEAQSKKQLTT